MKIILPPLVQKSLDAIEHGLYGDRFQLASHLVAKHYKYPVWRCEVVYRDPLLLPDGKWYKFGVQFPNKSKPDIIREKCDHSISRVLIFYVQDTEIKEDGAVVDFSKRPQNEWKLVEEKILKDHKVIVVGATA